MGGFWSSEKRKMIKFKRAGLKKQKYYKEKFGSSFQCGAIKYKAIFCEELFVDDEKCFGACDYKEKIIYVDVNMQDFQETLIHELYHAEAYEAGMCQMRSFYHDLHELCCEVASRVCRNFEIRRKNGKRK